MPDGWRERCLGGKHAYARARAPPHLPPLAPTRHSPLTRPPAPSSTTSALPLPTAPPAVSLANLFFSPSLTGGLIPEVGNGFVATHPLSDTIFAAGLFNGDQVPEPDCIRTHTNTQPPTANRQPPTANMQRQPPQMGKQGHVSARARIPAFLASIAPPAAAAAATGVRALDVERATFVRRRSFALPAGAGSVLVTDTWFAPLQVKRVVGALFWCPRGGSCTVAVLGVGQGGVYLHLAREDALHIQRARLLPPGRLDPSRLHALPRLASLTGRGRL
jgi:hypothetical protein